MRVRADDQEGGDGGEKQGRNGRGRDSKVTLLLQASLGANARTLMVSCVRLGEMKDNQASEETEEREKREQRRGRRGVGLFLFSFPCSPSFRCDLRPHFSLWLRFSLPLSSLLVLLTSIWRRLSTLSNMQTERKIFKTNQSSTAIPMLQESKHSRRESNSSNKN